MVLHSLFAAVAVVAMCVLPATAALQAQTAAPNAGHGKPNIVVILADDVGWSDLGCYGGEIATPNLDTLAKTGTRFREFYTTPRCAPSRAALLTGLYSHQVAVDPGASLPNLREDNNVTLAEVLRDQGYRTYMAGKWNLGNGPRLPENRGFQEVWRFSDGNAHSEPQWDIHRYKLVSPDHEIAERPYDGGKTFYQTDAVGDYSVDFINHSLKKENHAPFFLYMAFGAAHFPIGAPKAIADTYNPTYSKGWDAVRHDRYERQLAQGVIDARYPFPPRGGTASLHDGSEPTVEIPAWNTVEPDRQADLARRMSLYAALVQKMDENIGKVVTRLREAGQLDNTLIVFLSDNGANLEGGVFGTWDGTDHSSLTGAALANMGQRGMHDGIRYGGGWAHVSNTPLRLFKHFAQEGGIRTPFIAHWPAGFKGNGGWNEQVGDIIDVMPTVAAAAGATYPTTYAGHPVLPTAGVNLLPALHGEALAPRALFIEHESNRMMREGQWKLVTKNFELADHSSPANQKELYDVSVDPGESRNVADQHPEVIKSMIKQWDAWAAKVGVPPGHRFAAGSPAGTDGGD